MKNITKSILCLILVLAMLLTPAFAEEIQGEPDASEAVVEEVEEERIKLPNAKWDVAYRFSLVVDADKDATVRIDGELPEGIEFDAKKSSLSGTPVSSDAGKTFKFALQTVDAEGNVLTSDNYSILVESRLIKSIELTGPIPEIETTPDAAQKERVRCVADEGVVEVKKDSINVSWFEIDDNDTRSSFKEFQNGKNYLESITIRIPEGYAPDDQMQVELNKDPIRPFINEEKHTIELRRYFYNYGVDERNVTLSFDMNTPKEGENDIPKSRIKKTTPSQKLVVGNHALDPIDPSIDGYVFCGWFNDLEEESPFNFEETRLFENTKLYAKWVKELSKVEIELNAVFAGSATRLPAATVSEYYSTEILGWYLDADSEDVFDGKLELNETYYIKGRIAVKEGKAVFADEGVDVYVDGFKAALTQEEDGSYTFMAPVMITVALHEHVMEEVAATEPTCESDGHFAHFLCKSCGNRYLDEAGEVLLTEENGIIPAIGHKYGPWTVRTEPTCEKEGEEIRVCQNDESHIETRTVPAIGHDWGEWSQVTAPTCDAAGSETRQCKNDASHTEVSTIPALGHNFGEWEVTRASTCKDAGEETRYCENNKEHKETRPLPLVNHTWGEWQTTKNPTEKENGEMERTCSVCGKKETQIIPTLKHSHSLSHKAAVPATCTKFGNIEYYQCDSCKRMFSDKEGKNEIQTVTTAKKNHSWGEWKIVQNASTEFTGLRTRTCSICGEQQAETIAKIETAKNMNYKITNAADLHWTQGETYSLQVTSDGPGGRMTGVYMDGQVVSVTNYTYKRNIDKDDVTNVDLKAEYLNKLDVGEHALEIRYTNGTASAKLVVEAAPVPSVEPTTVPTADPGTVQPNPTSAPTTVVDGSRAKSSGPWLVIFLLSAILLGAIGFVLYKNGTLKRVFGKEPEYDNEIVEKYSREYDAVFGPAQNSQAEPHQPIDQSAFDEDTYQAKH